jgi:hypothetical protein
MFMTLGRNRGAEADRVCIVNIKVTVYCNIAVRCIWGDDEEEWLVCVHSVIEESIRFLSQNVCDVFSLAVRWWIVIALEAAV